MGARVTFMTYTLRSFKRVLLKCFLWLDALYLLLNYIFGKTVDWSSNKSIYNGHISWDLEIGGSSSDSCSSLFMELYGFNDEVEVWMVRMVHLTHLVAESFFLQNLIVCVIEDFQNHLLMNRNANSNISPCFTQTCTELKVIQTVWSCPVVWT